MMKALFVAWRPGLPEQTGWRPVGRLERDGALYRFCYTVGAKKPGFRPFAQMERLDQVYESEELFPLFANRFSSKGRKKGTFMFIIDLRSVSAYSLSHAPNGASLCWRRLLSRDQSR